MVLSEVMQWLGFGLCHQLPERSFFGGGVQLPVCARDTGIYVGFVVSFALIGLLHRPRRPHNLPGALGMVAIVLGIGLMAFDGASSYLGLRETSNQLRLLTGLTAGFAIGAMVFPLLVGEIFKHSDPERILAPAWRFGVWLIAVPATYAVTWWLAPLLGVGYPILVSICIIATFTVVNMVIASLLPPFERSVERPRDLVAPALVGLALTAVEIAASAWIRVQLLAFLSRLS